MSHGIYTLTNKFRCPKCDSNAYSVGKSIWTKPFLKRRLECRNLKCSVKTFSTWESTVNPEDEKRKLNHLKDMIDKLNQFVQQWQQ